MHSCLVERRGERNVCGYKFDWDEDRGWWLVYGVSCDEKEDGVGAGESFVEETFCSQEKAFQNFVNFQLCLPKKFPLRESRINLFHKSSLLTSIPISQAWLHSSLVTQSVTIEKSTADVPLHKRYLRLAVHRRMRWSEVIIRSSSGWLCAMEIPLELHPEPFAPFMNKRKKSCWSRFHLFTFFSAVLQPADCSQNAFQLLCCGPC